MKGPKLNSKRSFPVPYYMAEQRRQVDKIVDASFYKLNELHYTGLSAFRTRGKWEILNRKANLNKYGVEQVAATIDEIQERKAYLQDGITLEGLDQTIAASVITNNDLILKQLIARLETLVIIEKESLHTMLSFELQKKLFIALRHS